MRPTRVTLSAKAKKQVRRAPKDVVEQLGYWIDLVLGEGLRTAQTTRAYRDHGLKGERRGQRAFRLSYQWRGIYTVSDDGDTVVVTIEEVTPHDY